MKHEGSDFYMTHFKRIVINDLLSNVALSAFNIYTIWYLANVVHSQSAVALFGCAGFVEIVLASFGGRMSDRFPRINLIRIGSVARMVALLVLIVMQKMSVSFTAVSVAVGCVLSFVTSFYLPAIETIAPAFSEDDDELIRNNASLNMVQQLATILGSALSGVLVLLKSALVSYGIILVIMVASCVMMLKIPSDSVSRDETETDESMLDSLRQVVHLEVIRVLLPYATLINVSFWLYWYLTPMYLARRLPDFKAAYSIQEMTIGITAGVSGFLFSHVVRDASRHLHGYAQWLVLQGVGIALFPLGAVFLTNQKVLLTLLVVSWIVYGIANYMTGTIFVTIVQKKTADKMLGVTYGVVFSLFGAIAPLSSVFSPAFSSIGPVGLLLLTMPMIVLPAVMMVDRRVNGLMRGV